MSHMHSAFPRGGNSLDYQFMHLGDVDVCNTIEDGDAVMWSEEVARFVPGKFLTETQHALLPHPGGSLPAGIICMWSGLLANIPTGWALCDGLNGTPDLRGMFILGATGEPGQTGGAASHTHTSHAALAHSGVVVSDHAAHTHDFSGVINHTHGVSDAGHNHVQDAHTHTQNSHNHVQDAHTHVQNSHNHVQDAHAHVQNSHTHPSIQVQGGTTASNSGTHIMTSTATGGSSRAATTPEAANAATATNQNATPTNQAATATNQNATATNQAATATNQNATATNQSAVTGVTTQNPAGGVASAATGNPSATLGHSVSQPADHATQAHDSVSNLPPYFALAFIMKM